MAYVMQATSDGVPQDVQAKKLGVHQSTVSRLLSRAIDLLGAKNTLHAIKLAERQGALR